MVEIFNLVLDISEKVTINSQKFPSGNLQKFPNDNPS